MVEKDGDGGALEGDAAKVFDTDGVCERRALEREGTFVGGFEKDGPLEKAEFGPLEAEPLEKAELLGKAESLEAKPLEKADPFDRATALEDTFGVSVGKLVTDKLSKLDAENEDENELELPLEKLYWGLEGFCWEKSYGLEEASSGML